MDSSRRLVVLADIVDSRSLPAEQRRAVQDRIQAVTDDNLAFRFTGGDEFEWALPDQPDALDQLLLMRAQLAVPADGAPAVQLRCGLGRGAITVTSRQGPYAEDGPAYHRARAAYTELRQADGRSRSSHDAPFEPAGRAPRLTCLHDGREDPVRDALLVLMDAIMTSWNPARWEAIRLRLQGLRLESAGEQLGISAQAVQQRLKTADLDRYLVGHAALKAAWSTPAVVP